MSGFRIKLFRNCKSTPGTVISIPDSYENLLKIASSYFNEEITEIYLMDGSLITSINLIRDNDTVYAANKEKFHHNQGYPKEQHCHCPCLKGKTGSDWLTLNVGGKRFTTTRNTLARFEDTMLSKMFSKKDNWRSAVDDSGAYLIDRSPEYFEPILNFLRNGKLVINEGINLRGVLEEARFFGINGVVHELEMKLQVMEKEKSCVTRDEFMRILMTTSNIDQLRCQGVNFSCADLSFLDLSSINFKYANLSGANLTGTSLSFCDFLLADLSNACLDDAMMEGVQMKRTNLEGATLKNCKFEPTSEIKRQVSNLEGANLKGATLEGSQMSGICIRLATLKGANMRNCVLREANLAGSDLENCDLTGADIEGANLRGANVVGTIFLDIVKPLHMAHLMSTR